jgi:hypothetical protein
MAIEGYEIVVKLPASKGRERAVAIAESLVSGRGSLEASVYEINGEIEGAAGSVLITSTAARSAASRSWRGMST